MTGKTTDTGVWKATRGLNHPPDDQRVEAGEKVRNLLPSSIGPLLEMDAIEPHDSVAKRIAAQHAANTEEG